MTIKDIARKTGFAVSTVSRALNDHPDVSAKTKQTIRALVEEVGFVPNANARQLKVQQGRSIVIVVKGAFNLFFAALLEHAQTLLSQEGYATDVSYLHEEDDEAAEGERLQRERKPLGMLFLGGSADAVNARLGKSGMAVAMATAVAPTSTAAHLSCVSVDDAAAGAAAFRFLYEKGHRTIAVIGGNTARSPVSALRYKGFCRAAKEAGVPPQPMLYGQTQFGLEGGYSAMQTLLKSAQQFTAVFCMSDLTAMGAMRALCDAGLRVPQDVSVLGFDGLPLGRFCSPRLASMYQPQKDIAETAVRLLLAQIEQGSDGNTVVLPAVLVEGESVAARALKR